MNLLFFDIESTGVPANYNAPMSDLENWPRVIQLAYLVTNESGETLNQFASLITPDNWEIPEQAFWLMHGFSTEKNLKEGIPMPVVLDVFIKDYNECHCLISHNLSFDYNVLGAELIRYCKQGRKDPDRLKICTMQVGTDVCKIPFGRDRRPWMNKSWKFPKLLELYQHLFNRGFEGAHDALADCRAVKDCFFEMVKRGVIQLPVTVN